MVTYQDNIWTLNLFWDEPPLDLLTDDQKLQFKQSAQVSRHILGDILWSTQNPGGHLLLVSGKVKLIQESGKKIVLKPGDWFGDLLELAGHWHARAASQEVVVVLWRSLDWYDVATPDLREEWEERRWQYQPFDVRLPHPVSGYPYVFSLNTAAACLTMAMQHLQTPIPLKQVQRQVRGQSPQAMVEAGEKLGLQLQHLQTDWVSLADLSYPALLHWRQERWIMVYGVEGNRIVVADPENSHKRCESLPREHIEDAWDGQLWSVEPLPKAESFNLGWFLPAIWKYKGLLIEVLLASFILQLLGLATPMITQVIIDKVIVHESLPTLNVMAIALLSVATFEALLGILRMYLFTHTARRLDLSLSSQLFRHLLQLPLAYFESRRTGDTVARVQELENIRQFLTGTALTVVLDCIFMVVYLGLMLYYNVTLTWIALSVVPIFITLILVVTPILRNWLNESFNRHADSQSFLVETVTGIHAIKAHTAQIPTRERWEGLFARYVRTSFKASTVSNIDSHLGEFLTHFSELLILWFGANLVIQHQLTVGQLVAFQMLSGRAIAPLLRLAQLWQSFQQVLLSVNRLGDILNTAPEATAETGLVLPPLQGQVSFEKVFFRYAPHLDPVLKGISFTVQPGMTIGIVGRSGSGKSTLSKLIQRLYQPEAGRILLDGSDVKSANLTSLRQQIGVVLQDDFLFNGTVFDNLTFGNSEIPPEKVLEAAKLAVADDFITELPHGYESSIGERGTGLSGGQRQRLTLTRLFLSDAPILILDEATSALDSETERKVLDNLHKVAKNRTVLMITHRFAPLRRADLILVLEKGVLVEQGSPEELMRRKGVYWALYEQQQASV